MKAGKLLLVALGVLFLVLGMLMLVANAVAVQQPFPVIYVNSGQVIPFLVSLNTVGGKAYYATISLSAQTGLTASSNVTAYPASGTSTTNTTIPIGISISGNPGVYQLNITVTEYNSTTAPQGILATYKFTTYVHIISPQTLPTLLVASTIASQQKSISITIPQGASGWYIKYKVLYPNASIAPGIFGQQAFGVPSVNVSVVPSATSGTTNTTVMFNVTAKSNLKFGEIPVTIIVYEYLQGTNALYATQVLHFNFFIMPPNAQGLLVAASRFANFTVVGHARFGNISIMSANIPAAILSIVKGSNVVQILFNDSFTGLVSFQTNVTPIAVYADGQKLTQVFYTVPANMPLGTWAEIGNTVYINADPSNVTVVYSNTTTTTSSTPTSGSTTSTPSTGTATPTGYVTTTSALSGLTSFYEQHKDLVLISIAFLFIIIIVVIASSSRR